MQLRTEDEVRLELSRLRRFQKQEGHLIDEMIGEVYALEYVLEEREDLLGN